MSIYIASITTPHSDTVSSWGLSSCTRQCVKQYTKSLCSKPRLMHHTTSLIIIQHNKGQVMTSSDDLTSQLMPYNTPHRHQKEALNTKFWCIRIQWNEFSWVVTFTINNLLTPPLQCPFTESFHNNIFCNYCIDLEYIIFMLHYFVTTTFK